jgi:hypothetical protein
MKMSMDRDVPGPKRDYVGYGRHVPKVQWPNGARLALSLVLNWEEGSEYSYPAGDNCNEGMAEILHTMIPFYRDLCVESVFKYGVAPGSGGFSDCSTSSTSSAHSSVARSPLNATRR